MMKSVSLSIPRPSLKMNESGPSRPHHGYEKARTTTASGIPQPSHLCSRRYFRYEARHEEIVEPPLLGAFGACGPAWLTVPPAPVLRGGPKDGTRGSRSAR